MSLQTLEGTSYTHFSHPPSLHCAPKPLCHCDNYALQASTMNFGTVTMHFASWPLCTKILSMTLFVSTTALFSVWRMLIAQLQTACIIVHSWKDNSPKSTAFKNSAESGRTCMPMLGLQHPVWKTACQHYREERLACRKLLVRTEQTQTASLFSHLAKPPAALCCLSTFSHLTRL